MHCAPILPRALLVLQDGGIKSSCCYSPVYSSLQALLTVLRSTWWHWRDTDSHMATSEAGNFRLPPQLDINSGNISENFKRWKRQVEVYLAASGATAKSKKVQTAIILNCAGPQVLEVYDNLTWNEAEDADKPDKVLEALERYCNPRDNEVIESHRFWNIPYQEPFDKFYT